MKGDAPADGFNGFARQVVVEIVLHVLVAAAEVVPAVLGDSQPRGLFGIATPSEAVQRQACRRCPGA